jgi:hypothetical protein
MHTGVVVSIIISAHHTTIALSLFARAENFVLFFPSGVGVRARSHNCRRDKIIRSTFARGNSKISSAAPEE